MEKLMVQPGITKRPISGKRVKLAMLNSDVTQIYLVQKYGIDRGDLSKVISGQRKTPHIREVIASEVGLPVSELFE